MADWVDGFYEERARLLHEARHRDISKDIQFAEDKKFFEAIVKVALDVTEDDLRGQLDR